MESEIARLIALADEMAAARRWEDAKALQLAAQQLRAMLDEMNDD